MKEHKKLLEASLDTMQRLSNELKESVGLAVLQAEEALVIGQSKSTNGFGFHLTVGQSIKLHTSAPGKSLLARLPQEEQDDIISRIAFTKFTEKTIITPKAFKEELKRVKRQGYGVDECEELEGCHCIGASIKDKDGRPVAAIWTTGPSSHLPKEKFAEIGKLFNEATQVISQGLIKGKRSQQQQYMEKIIARAQRIIARDYASDIDMEELAKMLHVSYTWFRRSFKKNTGKSPHQYQLDYRLEKAAYLLKETETPIKEITARLGFNSIEYFSTIFKKKHGLSPRNFRNE